DTVDIGWCCADVGQALSRRLRIPRKDLLAPRGIVARIPLRLARGGDVLPLVPRRQASAARLAVRACRKPARVNDGLVRIFLRGRCRGRPMLEILLVREYAGDAIASPFGMVGEEGRELGVRDRCRIETKGLHVDALGCVCRGKNGFERSRGNRLQLLRFAFDPCFRRDRDFRRRCIREGRKREAEHEERESEEGCAPPPWPSPAAQGRERLCRHPVARAIRTSCTAEGWGGGLFE